MGVPSCDYALPCLLPPYLYCAGLQAENGLHSHSGTTAEHSGGLLEDDVGVSVWMYCHVVSAGRRWTGELKHMLITLHDCNKNHMYLQKLQVYFALYVLGLVDDLYIPLSMVPLLMSCICVHVLRRAATATGQERWGR